jgi:hypothetical protein
MKISLRTLLLCVTLAGCFIAAMAQPSLFWMRVMFTLAVAFLVYAATGAVTMRGKPRTFWVGAVFFGTAYFAMLMDGRMIDSNQQSSTLPRALITQHVLDWIADAKGLYVRSGNGDFKLWEDSIYQIGNQSGGFGSGGPGGSSMSVGSMSGSMGPPPGSPAMGVPGMGSGSGMMPGAGAPPVTGPITYATYNHFLIIGHCCFVILAGLGGGIVSLWTFWRDDARQSAASVT